MPTGNKWGCRIAWNYWINVALWIASLAVLFNDTLTQITGWDLPVWAGIAIQLALYLGGHPDGQGQDQRRASG